MDSTARRLEPSGPDPVQESQRMALFRREEPSLDGLEPPQPGEDREIPVLGEELVLVHDPFGQISEQFRRLRNSLQALNPDGASRSVLMTSAVHGEGKTVSTLNLAIALAELPHLRILVVDADVGNPSVERYLGLPRRQGLSEVLRGRLPLELAVRQTALERFDVMGAGAPPRNPAEFLNVDRIRTVLHALKRSYDYVLIDAPPVLAMNHPSVIGSIADGILLVVRVGSTPKGLVEEAFVALENLGGNVLGTCVTDTREPDQRGVYRSR